MKFVFEMTPITFIANPLEAIETIFLFVNCRWRLLSCFLHFITHPVAVNVGGALLSEMLNTHLLLASVFMS